MVERILKMENHSLQNHDVCVGELMGKTIKRFEYIDEAKSKLLERYLQMDAAH